MNNLSQSKIWPQG